MRKQELQVLDDIRKIQHKQGILLDKPQLPQQQFLHIFGQRFLLSKKMLHRNIDQVLAYLLGTFGANALKLTYMSVCLQNRIELPLDQYPVLKMLVEWADFSQNIDKTQGLTLNEIAFQNRDPVIFGSLEEYITYLNLIASDLLKLIKTRKQDPEDLLAFISAALPKVLYNVLLPKDTVPGVIQQKTNVQCLFKQHSWQYFLRSKGSFNLLIKTVLKELIQLQLKQHQQKQMMDLVFRYFYAFHNDKKYQATDLFIQAFNSLTETTRINLKDQLTLFLRVLKKIGKTKFVDFLVGKSQLIKDILSKIDDRSLVGYPKDSLSPYNNAGLCEHISVGRGKIESRYLQVVEEYSLVYFTVQALSLDITVRLSYLGSVEGKPFNTLLSEQVKCSGEFKSNFMALKRGLYRFDFDNSYSWINGKTVRFENVVLQPLQIQSSIACGWKQAYFDNLPTNELNAPYQPYIIQSNAADRSRNVTGSASITKNGPFFNLKIIKSNHIYEFQTQNEDKFVSRCVEMSEKDEELQWNLFGQTLNGGEELGSKLSGKKIPAREKKMQPKLQQIDVNFEQEQEEQAEIK